MILRQVIVLMGKRLNLYPETHRIVSNCTTLLHREILGYIQSIPCWLSALTVGSGLGKVVEKKAGGGRSPWAQWDFLQHCYSNVFQKRT